MPSLSKKECESASYWKQNYPNQNIFVSYHQHIPTTHTTPLGCMFDSESTVSLVSNPNASLTIFSSCDQIHDSTVIENTTVVPDKEKNSTSGENLQQKEENFEHLIIYISSGVIAVLVLIIVVLFVIIRKTRENTVVLDENDIYGRNDPYQYYEDRIDTEISDVNSYY